MSETENGQVALVTPLSGEFLSLRQVIANALEESGLQPRSLENGKNEAFLEEAILQEIERADFIIADVTDNNPNVMYEVGFAHARRKPVLFLVQNKAKHVPSAISGYIYFVYDPLNPDELRDTIRTWANFYLTKGKRRDEDA